MYIYAFICLFMHFYSKKYITALAFPVSVLYYIQAFKNVPVRSDPVSGGILNKVSCDQNFEKARKQQ